MGTLTPFLQREFSRHCPSGWVCRPEVPLLSPQMEELLGYKSRADLLLENIDRSLRLWIEFEVSRADPVANHVKFATAHLFQPWRETDSFVAMVSNHVTRGRRDLAANTISLMRHLGIAAFQTTLLPHLSGFEIQRLNQLDSQAILLENISVNFEMERALAVSSPVILSGEHRIHFVGDVLDVILNLRNWNRDLATAAGREKWGRRNITYFVYEPRSRDFAPSKFCAYLVGQPRTAGFPLITPMTVDFYVTLDESETRFDGHLARNHLERHLAMKTRKSDEVPEIRSDFERWHQQYRNHITIHAEGPVFLVSQG